MKEALDIRVLVSTIVRKVPRLQSRSLEARAAIGAQPNPRVNPGHQLHQQ